VPRKKQLTSARAEIGLAGRVLTRVILNPLISLAVLGSVVAAVSAAPTTGIMYLFLGLLAPWLFIGILLISLPLLGAARNLFTLPTAIRCNHTLEHGTITVLRETYGRARKLSGRSDEQGFRVAGAEDQRDITSAFAAATRKLESGEREFVVARGCGSMVVTAQAIGLALYSATGVVFVFAGAPPTVVLPTILGEYALIVLLRYPVGLYLQRTRFLSFDFTNARITSITSVDRAQLLERHPVFFVRTQITPVKPE